MSYYRDSRPAALAYYREQARDRERRAAADLRPPHVILAEISARHPDTRSDAEIAAGQAALKAYIAANPLSAEDLAYDRQLETERRRALRARARHQEARAKAKRDRVRAKAAAKKQAAAERRQAGLSRRLNAHWQAQWALKGGR